MKKYLLITADVNDADYIHSKHEVSDEDLAILMPLIKAIKAFDDDKTIKYQKYNWWTMNESRETEQYMSPKKRYVELAGVSQEALDYFNDLRPYMDNANVHTIESIDIIEVASETKLL